MAEIIKKIANAGKIYSIGGGSTPAGASTLTDLEDTSIQTPEQGEVVMFDSTTNKWHNTPLTTLNEGEPTVDGEYVGQMYKDTTSGVMYIRNGTVWEAITSQEIVPMSSSLMMYAPVNTWTIQQKGFFFDYLDKDKVLTYKNITSRTEDVNATYVWENWIDMTFQSPRLKSPLKSLDWQINLWVKFPSISFTTHTNQKVNYNPESWEIESIEDWDASWYDLDKIKSVQFTRWDWVASNIVSYFDLDWTKYCVSRMYANLLESYVEITSETWEVKSIKWPTAYKWTFSFKAIYKNLIRMSFSSWSSTDKNALYFVKKDGDDFSLKALNVDVVMPSFFIDEENNCVYVSSGSSTTKNIIKVDLNTQTYENFLQANLEWSTNGKSIYLKDWEWCVRITSGSITYCNYLNINTLEATSSPTEEQKTKWLVFPKDSISEDLFLSHPIITCIDKIDTVEVYVPSVTESNYNFSDDMIKIKINWETVKEFSWQDYDTSKVLPTHRYTVWTTTYSLWQKDFKFNIDPVEVSWGNLNLEVIINENETWPDWEYKMIMYWSKSSTNSSTYFNIITE